ncbi:MFS transporter [Geodermatophilus sp. SYSU D00758]
MPHGDPQGAGSGPWRSLDRQQRQVLVCTLSANALVFFDQTAVTVALPAIGREFGARTDDLQWVVTSYLLALAALMAVAGRLGDAWGRRRVLLGGLALFGVGSALCALAPTLPLLVAARVLQGLGGAVLAPLALSTTVAVVGDQRRGWAVGVLATAGTSLLVLGPLLAGPLVAADWRWVFAVALPVVAVALAAGARAVPGGAPATAAVDWPAVALLLVGLGALVVGLVGLGRTGPAAPVSVVGGVLLLGVFLRRERGRTDPLVDVHALREPVLAGSLVALFAIQFAVFALTVPLALYLHHALGLGAVATGAVIALAGLGTPLLSLRTGRLADRRGPRALVLPGLLLAAAGLAAVGALAPTGSLLPLLPGLLAFAVARPMVFSPASAGALLALGAARRGQAAGLATEARQLGAVLGVTLTTLTALTAAGPTALAPGGAGHVAGFSTAVLVAAAVCALAAVVVWRRMPSPAADRGRPGGGVRPGAGS